MRQDAAEMYELPEGVETRWASAENPPGAKGQGAQAGGGRKGAPCFPLKSGDERVLAEVEGTTGTVRRLWVTISDGSPVMLRGLRLDFYWDGSARPAFSAPLGDFFGTSLGRAVPFQSALFTNPEGRSFNCYVPMPFRTGMKIRVANETKRDVALFFYDVNYTIGEARGPRDLYFHAHWRREKETVLRRDYEFLPRVEGAGRYLGVNAGVRANTELYFKSWWGEGEVKVFLDGDTRHPTLAGTGTEDYIGTGWGQGHYAHLYQGCHVADHDKLQYCFYRYHVPDPIYFRRDARVTIQQIGCWGLDNLLLMRHFKRDLRRPDAEGGPVDMDAACEAGGCGLFEREKDDWSSCAYFYLDRPCNDLPPLPDLAERVAGL